MSPFDDSLDVRTGLNETEFDLEPDSDQAARPETRLLREIDVRLDEKTDAA